MPPNPTRYKYDLRGVEAGRQVLPAGVYVGKITGADITEPDGKDPRIELVVSVKEGGNDYTLYEYYNLVSDHPFVKGKLRELLEAVDVIGNGKGEAGTLDTKKHLLGKSVGVRTTVRPETDEFDAQAKIRRVFAPDSDSATAPEDLDAEPEADGEGEGETPYDDLSLADLRKEARARGIKTVRLGAEEIISALMDYDAQEEAEAEAEPEPEAIDVSALSIAELKALAREHGVKVAGKKASDLRNELDELINGAEEEPSEDDELLEDDEPEAEEEPEPEAVTEDDYDEWPIEDLKTEAKDRSLSDRGGKGVLIARLRRDDAEGDKPF